MGNMYFHPAPGLGDLLPGWTVVPQNPIQAAAYGTTYIPGIGDILPGSFPVPQNPVKDYVTGSVKLIGQRGKGVGCGCGCGGSGSCGQINGSAVGMGDFSSDFGAFTGDLKSGNFGAALNASIFGVPVWAVLGIGALFLFGGPGRSRYTRARAGARAYRSAYAD